MSFGCSSSHFCTFAVTNNWAQVSGHSLTTHERSNQWIGRQHRLRCERSGNQHRAFSIGSFLRVLAIVSFLTAALTSTSSSADNVVGRG